MGRDDVRRRLGTVIADLEEIVEQEGAALTEEERTCVQELIEEVYDLDSQIGDTELDNLATRGDEEEYNTSVGDAEESA